MTDRLTPFSEYLQEVFDSSVPTRPVSKNNDQTSFAFDIGKTTYALRIGHLKDSRTGLTNYGVSFFVLKHDGLMVHDEMAMTNFNDSQFKVMSTITNEIKKYFSQVKLIDGDTITFAAKSSDRGRIALYTRLSGKIKSAIGSKLEIEDDNAGLVWFQITR